MAYTEEVLVAAVNTANGSGKAAADVLTSAASHGEDLLHASMRLTRLMFHVTVDVVGTTNAPVVTFKKRPTSGSATGETTIGTLTIPTGTAAGTVLYKDVSPVELEAGNSIELSVSTAALGGTPAGAGFYGYRLSDNPEDPRNQSSMLKSV